MNRIFLAVACLSLCMRAWAAGLVKPNHLTPEEISQGWLLLWDGETMFGWEPHGAAQWKISNGALVGDSADGGWLGTIAQFADFVLKLEFRTAAKGNSGIFLRSAREGPPHLTGYELQIYDEHPAGYNTGSLVNYAKASEAKIVPGEWNSFEITAAGNHFTVVYNGEKVLDATVSQHSVGVIGLQYNFGKKVEFRNIKLRPLSLQPIFNGEDLTGWTRLQRPGIKAPAEWTVRDGAIHVERGPGELETEGSWDDFVLQLDARCNALSPANHPNSGIFLRGDPGQFWSGYESQIRNEYRDGNRSLAVDYGTGGIYHLQPARRVVSSDNEFFTNTIIAQGRQLSVWVNGYQVSSYYDSRPEGPEARTQARLASGPIGLQAHDPTTNLDFRNIRIAALPKRD